MRNDEKALIYDECIRESDNLQRVNSRLKSDFVGNIPPHIQEQIDNNDNRLQFLVKRLESLFS
jgi:hypothetical protein